MLGFHAHPRSLRWVCGGFGTCCSASTVGTEVCIEQRDWTDASCDTTRDETSLHTAYLAVLPAMRVPNVAVDQIPMAQLYLEMISAFWACIYVLALWDLRIIWAHWILGPERQIRLFLGQCFQAPTAPDWGRYMAPRVFGGLQTLCGDSVQSYP